MRISTQSVARGNVLLCVLCTILIVSLIGGNVLLNCMTRYNAASSQVRSTQRRQAATSPMPKFAKQFRIRHTHSAVGLIPAAPTQILRLPTAKIV
jgi:hypothetical protein